ncbi:hypothetical protein MC885_011383, partial [Smutsia gigantea]
MLWSPTVGAAFAASSWWTGREISPEDPGTSAWNTGPVPSLPGPARPFPLTSTGAHLSPCRRGPLSGPPLGGAAFARWGCAVDTALPATRPPSQASVQTGACLHRGRFRAPGQLQPDWVPLTLRACGHPIDHVRPSPGPCGVASGGQRPAREARPHHGSGTRPRLASLSLPPPGSSSWPSGHPSDALSLSFQATGSRQGATLPMSTTSPAGDLGSVKSHASNCFCDKQKRGPGDLCGSPAPMVSFVSSWLRQSTPQMRAPPFTH